jgi:hypothetical protein
MVVPTAPPPDIQEIPPDERPYGEQFIWVPGYWSWGEDRNTYIWVSACWRAAPPSMVWVPGFWMPAGAEEIEYLPAPPAPVDLQPPGPPPSANRVWVPGCWYWQGGRYVRRSGYWLQPQADWVWVPSHYLWTPRGYVFCQGRWDYALERRGVLFAPVYFPRSVYGRPGFTYSPVIAIDVGMLQVNLFVYPRYSHYYFGDYYDDAYVRIGIYPRYESARRHTYYDPIYVQDRWRNQRTDPRWEERQKQEYDRRRDDRNLRPARTYREQETRMAALPEPQRQAQRVAQPLTAVVTRQETPLKFERIEPDARQKVANQANQMHKFREDRNRWEAAAEDRPKAAEPPTKARPPVAPRSPPEASPPAGPATAPPRVVRPPAEKKEPVTPPPADRQGPARGENKGPAPTVAPGPKREPPVAADRTPSVVAPRKVRVTQPEKVRIPKPPIVGKPPDSHKPEFAPPPKPEEERQGETDTKGRERGPDKVKERGNEPDKDRGKEKNRDKDGR